MVDRLCWAEIELSAIAGNTAKLAGLLPPESSLCAVVKADGYGHGAAPVARSCLSSGAKSLAVAFAEEGVELRHAGIREPILVLGYTGEEGARRALGYGLSVTVVSAENARLLSREAERMGRTAGVHLKIDTGMERLGVEPREAPGLVALIASLPGLRLEGISSHFANADASDGAFAALQLQRFLDAASSIESAGLRVPVRHIANSAGLIFHPESRLDMSRPGIAIYGLRASRDRIPPFKLSPALSLRSIVTQIRSVPKGVTVGYGRTFCAARDTRLAVLPVGYADGVFRALSNRGSVGFPSGRAAIVGTVCMDQMMVDVTELPAVRAGSVATIFGEGGPPVSEVADLLGTIDYEISCALSKRVPRIYV
jgi:alanine racemase